MSEAQDSLDVQLPQVERSTLMSALAVQNRSLFDAPITLTRPSETPHRENRAMRIWRQLPAPRDEPEQAQNVERIDEYCERWDGLS